MLLVPQNMGKENRYGKTFLLHLSAHWGDLIEQIKKSVIYTLSSNGNNAKDKVDQKTTQYSTYESSEKLNSFSLSIVSEASQTEYLRRLQNSTKEILKIGRRKVHVLSNKQN